MGIFDKLRRLIFPANAGSANQFRSSQPRSTAVEANARLLPDSEAADSGVKDVPARVHPESLELQGKEIEIPDKSAPDRQQCTASVVRVIRMSVKSHFRVIDESLEMARKSTNLETKFSLLGVARNRLEKAQKLATQFSLETEGFATAEAAIKRIDEAARAAAPAEIPGTQPAEANFTYLPAARERGDRKPPNANSKPVTQKAAKNSGLVDYRKNAKDYECLQWLATLDAETCLICAARDLQRYTIMDDPPVPIGHTLPWNRGPGAIHSRCRCVVIGVAKPIRGMPKAPPGTRASDEGQMPATMCFEQFLRRKGRAFQEQVLGVARAHIWRSRKLTLVELISDNGRPLTLAQLKAKYGQRKNVMRTRTA